MRSTDVAQIHPNSRVWVTAGTSSGLGQSVVKVALARGDHVIATARNVDSIHDFANNPDTAKRVHLMKLDVTAPFSDLRVLAGEAVSKWGRVDVLVNNAGAGFLGITEEVGVEGYQKQFVVNFFGQLSVTNAFLPYMRARREGTIVFVGSRSSWRTNVPVPMPHPKPLLQATAAEALAVEVAPLNIKVLNVIPGAMKTDGWNKKTLLPATADALLPPLIKQENANSFQNNNNSGTSGSSTTNVTDENTEKRIVDYVELRNRQIKWMSSLDLHGDTEKCAHAIFDIVGGNNDGSAHPNNNTGRKWPESGLLVLGADAEKNVRDKIDMILKDLDEWKDVTRGIALDSYSKS